MPVYICRTGETAHQSPFAMGALNQELKQSSDRLKEAQFTISLNFFIGRQRTVLLAGFALKTQGSFVNGLTPFLAARAGFFLSFMLRTPPSLNLPFFFNSAAARATYAVMTPFTTFALMPAPSAMLVKAWLAVKPDAPAFFMAFIAGAMVPTTKCKDGNCW